MFDIIAIGSATRDNFLKADYRLVDWTEAPSKKAIALPFGEKLEVNEVYFTIGGNAVNASVTFSRQGFKTACLAKLGDDNNGQELVNRLKKERVNKKLIAFSKEKGTAYSVLLLGSEDGERTILGYHGASDTLTLEDFKLSKLKSRWWYVSLAGESDKIYPELIAFAKENGIKVAFNPSGHHIKHRPKEILDSLKDLAFLVLNEGEAASLLGMPFDDEEKVFRKLDEITPGIIAITNGPKGVTVSDGKLIYKAGIFEGPVPVDRTGAGDAFGSGFVSGLMIKEFENRNKKEFSDEDIKYAVRLASANATAVVEKIGATEGILTKKDFEQNSRWANFEIQTKKL